MANTAEADICNVALARIGQRQFITSLDTTVDLSEMAAVCSVLYPAVRDRLLSHQGWGFASRQRTLAPAAIWPADVASQPGYAHCYSDPTDILQAQYIFIGIRPGAAALPLLDSSLIALAMPQTLMVPAINGRVPAIPFQRSGGYVFTDWSDAPSAWSSTLSYSLNQVAIGSDGVFYRSKIDNNFNHNPAGGGASADWNATVGGPDGTDYSSVLLVYTAKVTDATTFPPLWVDALRWLLALELALNQPKPELVAGLREGFERAAALAGAAEENFSESEFRPDSSFITARN